MKPLKCRKCAKFRQYYYKGRKCLMPSDFGRCIKELMNPVEAKELCEFYEERQEIMLNRRQNILEMLPGYLEEINDLLLILLSDKQESDK